MKKLVFFCQFWPDGVVFYYQEKHEKRDARVSTHFFPYLPVFTKNCVLLATTIDSLSELLEFFLFSNADLKLISSHAI